jgi:hypothetical protein
MSISRKIFLLAGGIVFWFALSLQFYLVVPVWSVQGLSLLGIVVRFFSFFTILSNFLAAVWFTAMIIKKSGSLFNFFSNPRVQTAITIYITIVGLGYAFLLRALWAPQGLQWIADELLHSVNPLLVLIYWIAFVPKKDLGHKDVPLWLVFPAVYIIYILIRGALVGWYPYPFIDVNQLGYAKAFAAIFWLTIAIVIIAGMFVFIPRAIAAIKK